MNIQLDWDSVIKIAAGFLGGSGLVAFIFKEAIKEQRSKGSVKWKEKRQLAKDIIAFVDEGQGAGFEILFDSTRFKEASRLVSHTLPYSPKLSEKINQLQGLWAVYAMMNPERMKIPAHQYSDHIKSLSEKRKIIDKKADEIRKEVVNWLK